MHFELLIIVRWNTFNILDINIWTNVKLTKQDKLDKSTPSNVSTTQPAQSQPTIKY